MKPPYSALTSPWMAILSITLVFLASPLTAKCPMCSVDIRGKIACSLKPDDKVMVTLIFSGNQRIDPGEDTAMEIQNDTFVGRLSFDTHSSSTLFGDRCHRRPEKVLIRLVESDGEKDRA